MASHPGMPERWRRVEAAPSRVRLRIRAGVVAWEDTTNLSRFPAASTVMTVNGVGAKACKEEAGPWDAPEGVEVVEEEVEEDNPELAAPFDESPPTPGEAEEEEEEEEDEDEEEEEEEDVLIFAEAAELELEAAPANTEAVVEEVRMRMATMGGLKCCREGVGGAAPPPGEAAAAA